MVIIWLYNGQIIKSISYPKIGWEMLCHLLFSMQEIPLFVFSYASTDKVFNITLFTRKRDIKLGYHCKKDKVIDLSFCQRSTCLWNYSGKGNNPVRIVVRNAALVPDDNGFSGR